MLYGINFIALERPLPNRLRVTAAYPSRQSEAVREDNLVALNLRVSAAPLTFEDAQLRLLDYIRNRIRNGELTERALARQIGISQPHVHNALKGVRTLSPKILDSILRHFRLSLVDLFCRQISFEDPTVESNSSGLFKLPCAQKQECRLTARVAS